MNTLTKSISQLYNLKQASQSLSDKAKPSEAIDKLLAEYDIFLKDLDSKKLELAKPENRKEIKVGVDLSTDVVKNYVDALGAETKPIDRDEALALVIAAVGIGISIGTMKTALTLIKEKTGGEEKPPEPVTGIIGSPR